eukprot:5412768-Alexandrium_andersonii.AAC.1
MVSFPCTFGARSGRQSASRSFRVLGCLQLLVRGLTCVGNRATRILRFWPVRQLGSQVSSPGLQREAIVSDVV